MERELTMEFAELPKRLLWLRLAGWEWAKDAADDAAVEAMRSLFILHGWNGCDWRRRNG